MGNCPFELFNDYMKNVENEIAGLKSQIALLTLKLQYSASVPPLNLRSSSELSATASEQSPRSLEAAREARAEYVSRLECKHTKVHHTRNVTSLALGDRGFFFSASHDTAICMWDSETCDLKHQFSGNKDSVWALAYNDGVLYSGSEGSLTAWSVPTGSNISQHHAPGGSFTFKAAGESKTYCLIPDSKSQQLLFSGNYKTICMWDKNSRERVTRLVAHDDCVWTLAWLEDKLVSGSDDGTVKVWDLKKLDAPLKTFEFADSRFLSVAAGGGYIFGGTQSGQTQVWSASTFQHVTSLRGHQWDVWQLAYVGGLLCSGSYDHTIKIWDIESMTSMKTLTGHRSNIYALKAEELDRKGDIRLISGSGDKTIKIWEAPRPEHRASSTTGHQ
jgi:WD40 repeat protein